MGGWEEEEEEERAHISFIVRLVSTGDKYDPAPDAVISHVRQIQAVATLQLLCSNVRSVYFLKEKKKGGNKAEVWNLHSVLLLHSPCPLSGLPSSSS